MIALTVATRRDGFRLYSLLKARTQMASKSQVTTRLDVADVVADLAPVRARSHS